MAYLAPVHRPSSVRLTLRLNLLDHREECLVLAKANRLEIWRATEEGLTMAYSKSIYGRISMLQKIQPAGSKTDHLFVGTVRAQYFTVMWNPNTHKLDTMQSFVDISQEHMRDSESRDRCLVDPTGRLLVMELYEGVLNLVKIVKPRGGKTDYLEKPEQVRISEMKVRASAFLYTDTKQPKLALLYQDARENVRLATYRMLDDKGHPNLQFDPKKNRENDVDDLCVGAMHIIPVPKGEDEGSKRYIVRNATTAKANLGGVVVLGETKFTYLDDESKAVVEYALDEAVLWAAWEPIDERNYLLGDDYGFLYLFTILVDGATVTGMKVLKLGQVSKPTSLENLGNGVFYVASHEADNQVIQIDLKGPDYSVTVLQVLPNIAPILDFTIMDMGGREGETQLNEYSSGQARLVTGSGGFEGGSLRSVRSGVGLDDIAILAEMEGIHKVFALHSGPSLPNDTLVVSFSTETRFFKFDTLGDIEEVKTICNLSTASETLLTYNLDNGCILQVTQHEVAIHGKSAGHRWQPPDGQIITAASGNRNYILLSSNGRTLVTLSIKQNLAEVAFQELGNDQVACIHVPQLLGDIGVIGLWKSGSISLLDLKTLNTIVSEDLRRNDGASIPRDIALTQILPPKLSGPTLFVSMEDGIVLSFDVDSENCSLSGRKSIVLGTQQARLQILPRDNTTFNVFATCEHPSLIYGSEGRTVYSAVTAEDAVTVCSFNSQAYPDSVVVATTNELKLSAIDNERRTHVRTLPIGETVRRIAYSAKERAFAIGAIKRELTKGQETVTTSFRLVDEVVFGELGEPFYLPPNDEIIESVIRAELPTKYGDGELVERFLVGTSFLHDNDVNIRGRLLIIGVNSDRTPYIIASHTLKGSCRCIGVLNGKIVAALNKTVVMYDYEETSRTTANLRKVATYRCATCPIDIDIRGNIIAVADIMKSVALVEYIPGVDGLPDKLEEVGRHAQQVFATSVAEVDTDTYLESDHDGNLIVLKRNREGITREDKLRLEVLCEMNLGEMVNKIKRINVETSKDALLIPRAFVATTEGSIYLFSLIPPQHQDLLMRLQTRLASLPARSLTDPSFTAPIEFSPGNLDFNKYRSYVSAVRETNEPFRFVDGELIERFLDLDGAVQEKICEGLGVRAEDLRGVVEGLRRLC
ncbi:c3801203-deb2-4578-b971-e9c97b2b48d6 [Sclerotinia trifoliorum]|uniref:DNA damage-binding protein 1 n=1 Tax=Sclerotinia trifoliorum TaxID=28548 RepID=A0A8H2ZS79_9HELO|nr:c3801203-deb2-4578-b971-e9c97b2b48d6 [Sclerotinia trifoliorum]